MEETMSSSATFLITGDNFDPDQVSKLIKLSPSYSWKKGDKRISKNGRTHVYDYAGWKLIQDKTMDKCSLEDQLRYWLKLFSNCSAQIKQFGELGYSIGIICFIVSDGFVSFSLDPNIIRGLSELGMELTVECSLNSKPGEK
jgi:hypothetical protein